MSGSFEVVLTAFPADRAHHIERTVHKHNRALTHQEVHAVVAAVAAGTPKVVGRYVEEHSAKNLVQELAYQKATAEISAPSDEAAA